MGITDKIQQKLSGNNNNQTEEERRLEQEQGSQWTRGPGDQYSAPQSSHVQHPIASQEARSGIVGGTALEHGGYGSDALNRDPTDTRFGGSTANPLTSSTGTHHTGTHHVGGNTTGTTGLTGNNNNTGLTGNNNARSGIVGGTALEGGYGSDALNRRDHTGVSSTSDKLRDTHLGGTTGTTTGIDSTTGNTYSASHNRGAVGDVGSRRDADHPEVRRTAGGGISNGGTDFISGPPERINNHDAIPTAGGQKVGGVGEDCNNNSSGPGPAPNTSGPHKSDLLNKADPRVTADPSKRDDTGFDNRHGHNTTTTTTTSTHNQHHLGRDAAVGAGAGAAGYGAYEATHSGSGPGPAPNTSGPHSKDILNKLDPRVTADPSKRDDTGFTGHNTTGSTTTSGLTGSTHDSSIDRHGHGTHAGTYGQDVSYNNSAGVNEPLTGSKDFNDRHHGHSGAGVGTAAGVGAGAGALAGSHHHDHHNNNSSHLGGSGLPTTSNTSSQRAAGVDRTDIGSSMAKRMGGAYEAGYRDGWRDHEHHNRPQV